MRTIQGGLIVHKLVQITQHILAHRQKGVHRFQKIISERFVAGAVLMRYNVINDTHNFGMLITLDISEYSAKACPKERQPKPHYHQIGAGIAQLLAYFYPIERVYRVDDR